MRILVWGKTGWIASQLAPLLEPVGDVIYANSRLEDVFETAAELDSVAPDRVVLCAGITGRPNVDWCEDNQEVTENVNFYGTVALIRACSERNIHVTNFATGCIFQYDTDHPVGGHEFTESDEPNFFGSVYSRVKGAAEMATRNLPHHLLLRVRMPITCDGAPRCFITKIANYKKIVSIPNSVSVLPDLLPLAVRLITDADEGVYNFVNPNPVQHSDIMDAYAEIVDPLSTYNVMSIAEHNTVVKAGRSNNALDTSKLQARFPDEHIPSAIDSIRALFAKNKPDLRKQYIPNSILVTGGAGFIGSELVRFLAASKTTAPIVVLDKLDDCASLKHLETCVGVKVVIGDILNKELVLSTIAAHGIDTIFHLAAQTHVDASFDNSLSFTETNVMGTHILLQAAVESKTIRRFVHMSTDEVYGETTDSVGAKEDRVLLPTNPYAASKVGAEALVHAYQKSFGLNTVVIRSNNVYGRRQYPEKVIPRFIVRHALGLPLQIQGSGWQFRNFVYVSDAVRAIAIIASKGAPGEIYNIGSEEEFTVQDLHDLIIDSCGSNTDTAHHVPDRPFNDCRYWVDDDKLRRLGWQQQVPFQDGLEFTKLWYADNLSKLDDIWPNWRTAIHALDRP